MKRFNKKLLLNKKTVADLNLDEMKAVNGGAGFTYDQVCLLTRPPYCQETDWTCPTGYPMTCHEP
jgi:hypothetical protein